MLYEVITVVDHSLDVIGQIASAVESVERDMLEDLNPDHLEQIHRLKREVIFFNNVITSYSIHYTKLYEGCPYLPRPFTLTLA